MARVPSLLGVGQHPTSVLPSLTPLGEDWNSALQYNEVSEYQVGTRFWAVPVTGLTAYVNGSAIDIPVGESIANPNIVDPIGVLDTGIPFIFGRTDVINAFYGAYGIEPGTDGSCVYSPLHDCVIPDRPRSLHQTTCLALLRLTCQYRLVLKCFQFTLLM